MAKIEGFRIKNFKVLKDVTLGQLWNRRENKPLTSMTAVIGKNGVGKSALFDAFGFLSDALTMGVEDACDARSRGGFEKIITQGEAQSIEFELYYRERSKDRPITYEIAIQADKFGRPFVLRERLRQRREGQRHGRPFSFLRLYNGRGVVWRGEHIAYQVEEETDDLHIINFIESIRLEESSDTEIVELEDRRKLGIATLGALKQHTRISAFRRFIEGWYLSYFTPDAARAIPLAGPQRHLSIHGDNLGNVVQFMERDQPRRFSTILRKVAERIPGIEKIDTEKTSDGRLLLRFQDQGFVDPFYAQQMSDGTLKLFAYLLLLEDPMPPPFLCIEEPENGLYHKLLDILASEFRDYTSRHRSGSQVFVTTHQPYFVDSLRPDEVWVLEKDKEGYSRIRRASEQPLVNELVEEELPLGGLWYSDYLDPR